jgi:hypothetical protein
VAAVKLSQNLITPEVWDDIITPTNTPGPVLMAAKLVATPFVSAPATTFVYDDGVVDCKLLNMFFIFN